MKTKLMVAAMAMAVSVSAPASAGLFDWMLGKAVENVVEEAVENAVEDALINALTRKDKPKAAKNSKNGKVLPPPVASTVEKDDHIRLPLTGRYRFPVPKGVALSDLETGPAGGYLDRFGSEWIPYRVNGRIVAWRSNLSERGQFRMGPLAERNNFVLVGRDGKKIKV